MTLYLDDLNYMTPDADGIVRLNRGITPQVKIPFKSFVGDVRFYRGLAADVGQGDLVGWALVGEISEGMLIRLATTDADVGVVSGSNTIQPTAQPITADTPTGTVDAAHNHGGATQASGNTPVGATAGGVNVMGASHTHPIVDGLVSPRTLDIDPIVFDPLVLDPVDIAPVSIGFFLIEFVGIAT